MVEINKIDLEVFLNECEGGLILYSNKESIVDTEEFKKSYNMEEFKKIYYINCNETRILIIDRNNIEIIIEMV